MRKIVLLLLVVPLVMAATAWAATTPGVLTGSATAVSDSGALLHGTVDPGGVSTSYSFQYGPSAAYGMATNLKQAGGTQAVAVQAKLAALSPGTLYHYRIAASNQFGSAVGLDRTFITTGHPPPLVVTDRATSVGKTTAILEGTVVSQGETTSSYFEYGTTPNYGMQTPVVDVTAATAPSYVSYTLTGLAPGTTFHYRVVAGHVGVALQKGLDETFTTIPLVRFRAKVTARTMPARARRRPYRFTTIGTVVPRVALPAGVGCTGVVRIRFLLGHRAVASRKAPVLSNCAFSTQVRFRHLIDHTATKLRVEVRFRGNSYLRPASARTRRVRLG